MTNIVISEHAIERMKERMGLKKKSCLRMAEKVFENGLSLEDSNGNLQYYMKQKIKNAPKTNRILKIYGNNCYIFAKDMHCITLVTVFQIPNEIVKDFTKKNKKQFA